MVAIVDLFRTVHNKEPFLHLLSRLGHHCWNQNYKKRRLKQFERISKNIYFGTSLRHGHFVINIRYMGMSSLFWVTYTLNIMRILLSRSLQNIFVMFDKKECSVMRPSLFVSNNLTSRSLMIPGRLQYWMKVTLSIFLSRLFYCADDTKLLKARSLYKSLKYGRRDSWMNFPSMFSS